MKKIILALPLMISLGAAAQPENRVFTVTNQAYTNLTSPTIITTPGWDDFDAKVPIGFSFSLMGKTTDTIYFDGDFNVGADMLMAPPTVVSNAIVFATDFIDRSIDPDTVRPVSTVGYQTSTTGSGTICKLEWRDIGFFGDTTSADSANFQLWLYQNSGDIEVHWGPSRIASNPLDIYTFGLPFFGFLKNSDASATIPFDYLYYVSNATISPRVDSLTFSQLMASPIVGFPVYPSNGTVFKFAKVVTGTKGTQLNSYASIYPTLFTDDINIDITEIGFKGTAVLIDMSGKIVVQAKITDGKNKLNTNGLAVGNYIVNIRSEKESVFYKITKQ